MARTEAGAESGAAGTGGGAAGGHGGPVTDGDGGGARSGGGAAGGGLGTVPASGRLPHSHVPALASLAARVARDPAPYYRLLHREPGPVRVPGTAGGGDGIWLVGRDADVRAALAAPGLVADAATGDVPGLVDGAGLLAGEGVRAAGAGAGLPSAGVRADAPPPRVAGVVARAGHVLAGRLGSRASADLVPEFCDWLPAVALGAALGLPYRRTEALRRWCRAGGPAPLPLPDALAVRARGAERATAYALASLLGALLTRPAHLAALREEPALIDAAWAETLRHDPPAPYLVLRARERVRLPGGAVSAGERVLCLLGAAGWDPAGYPDPGRWDPSRVGRTPVPAHPWPDLGLLTVRYGLPPLLGVRGLALAPGFAPRAVGVRVRGPRRLLVRLGG
ncbi:cytochrome [Streptomyces sp. NPDC088923]|uniref:cytochrome n=1 Tax=Streptomyces sp. NPDC088923 TaxID=3365913 RepID=UPI0037F7165D